MIDDSNEELERKLDELRVEHRKLDDHILGLELERPYNELLIKRLKKQKLSLKDQILVLENSLVPNIIA